MSGAHEDLVVLAPAYAIGALDSEERRAFEAHLATCATCASEVRSLGPVVNGLAQAVPLVTPRPELRDRVLAAVGAPAPRVTTTSVARAATPVATWLAYAALVVLAVGASLYAVNLRTRIADLEARLNDATARLLAADTQLADARRAAFEAQSATTVLVAPDLARFDLQGAPAAPQASGRALWSRANGMLFTASNLPPLPAGRVYQVWLVAGNMPISAGLVTRDDLGRGVTIFKTPPDITDPVVVAVTIEPEGGVPQPTGAFYLVTRS